MNQIMNKFKYSKTSLKRLDTCHDDLIIICETVLDISPIDITVICGHRKKEDQNKAFTKGFSRAPWPKSAHNQLPSKAVDLAPYVNGYIKWNDIKKLYLIAGLVLGVSMNPHIEVKWGGAWHGTLNVPHEFNDLYHFELIV